MESIALTAALLLMLGFACQWIAWRIQLPAILFLLLAGILIGPVLGLVDPDALLGDLLFPVVSLGVAVILFEGALTLRFEETRGIQGVIRNLVTVGVVITWLGMSAAAHYLAGFEWPLALLFGALVSVTGPTVIVPLLRSVRPTARIANILRWEGILIDPIGAILVVLVYELLLAGSATNPALAFALLALTGTVGGFVGAGVLAFLLRRHWIPEYLENFATLAWMLTVFTVTNHLEHESGLLAVTIMGVVLANQRDLHVEEILDFKENLTVVALSALFLLLGARVDLGLIAQYATASILLLAVAKLVVRPLSVAASAIGTGLKWRELAFLSWIGPRGIVAAAVASLFSLRLEEYGVAQAELLVPLVFALIVGTVVVESATARPVARMLGISAADEQGVLVVGANRVSLELADALRGLDVRVLITDTDYDALSTARMRGFDTWYGSVLSDRADRMLDLTGLTRIFAVTRSRDLNTLVCSRYRPEFGIEHCLTLQVTREQSSEGERRQLAPALRTPVLFGDDVSWRKLASLLAGDGEIRSTKLTEDFDFAAYRETYGDGFLPLFALDANGRLRVYRGEQSLQPTIGWTLCAVVQPVEGGSADALPVGGEAGPRPPDSGA